MVVPEQFNSRTAFADSKRAGCKYSDPWAGEPGRNQMQPIETPHMLGERTRPCRLAWRKRWNLPTLATGRPRGLPTF